MPYVHVSSNMPKASADVSAATRALSKSVSQALGKPEQYVMVQLDLDVPMLFQGSDEPCAFVHLRSIGKISEQLNSQTAKTITDAVAAALQVPAARIFMNLDDVQHFNWAMGGSTF